MAGLWVQWNSDPVDFIQKQNTVDAGNLKFKQKMLEILSRSGSVCGERNNFNVSDFWPFIKVCAMIEFGKMF